MKAVRFDGKVIGYIQQTKHPVLQDFKVMNAKKKKLGYALTRKSAVKALLVRHLEIEETLEELAVQALARIDKKGIPR